MQSIKKIRKKIRNRIIRANATLPEREYSFPLLVIVESTNICNLSCIMCPSSIQSRERGVMSFDIWKKIVDEVAEKSPESTIWPAIMGESLTIGGPFLEMLEYSYKKGVKVVLNTNAVLFTDELIDKILSFNLQEIIVGIDAVTSDTYNEIRRGGDFKRVVNNVLELLKRNTGKTRITVQFIEQETNSAETEDFKKFWLSKGANVKIRPQLGWGAGVKAPNLVLRQDERIGRCPWLIRTVSIHWNGRVVQCDADWDQKYVAGDLSVNTLEEIWNGELAKRRQKHHDNDFEFEPCKNCNDWQAGLSDFYIPDK